MIQIRAIFFDFDGPILDSFDPSIGPLVRACKKFNICFTKEHEEQLVELWGIKAEIMLREVFQLDIITSEALYRAWENATTNPLKIVSGAREALLYTHTAGMVNILFTSRDSQFVKKELARVDLARFFDILYTSDNTDYLKPNPLAFTKPLAMLKREFNIRREECIFIGDTWVDAVCGAGARVQTLIVLNGPYRFAWHARKCFVGKENIIDSIAGLSDWLNVRNPVFIN